ncbi:thiamine diphosphokinase [Gracilinema caldarium]|uniref:Thiamine diphosphokinase n=1 Tax=Gracilinema caldarium (strain ATCC 51460 / DSM 7334 / H1) TaxID=744872 RepID=F8F3H2_GRAC1|nr:thiamine diphosphokinase [Gracilinema caldarium]AEJ19548.1 thiamine pyrophosphokinase [Gracilinema caldarium DSM 7334]
MTTKKRALIFIGGAGPTFDLCKPFLDKPDLVIAADSGLLRCEAFGFSPDWIVGDMDSLGDLSRLSSYPKDRVLQYPVDKDYTDTELALNLAWDQGCTDITLIGGGGGRTDHLLAITALFDRPRAPNRWCTETELVSLVDHELTLSLPTDTLVSVFPAGSGPWDADSRGLQWPLRGLSWFRGFFGLSNRVTTSPCSVYACAGRFLVMVPLEAFLEIS